MAQETVGVILVSPTFVDNDERRDWSSQDMEAERCLDA
jgi:hypothetical protein